jgi:LuxR family maltose regulon positive regulatory protein
MIRSVRSDGRSDAGGVFTPFYRPRVQQRLSQAASQRVTMIVAPAGYGKSTALRHYLERLAAPYVFFGARPENAKLSGFARGLAEALGEVAPDAAKTVASARESAARSPSPADDLALWIYAHLRGFSGAIAIDDLQVTESDPSVSRFLAALVERTKGRVTWLFASRSYLDLPVGTWMAYQEMDLALDETDLRFTADEAREAARAAHVGVRDEELADLLALTEGWPTALSFALRSSTHSRDLRDVRATTRELAYRYLAEQVYGALSAPDREFLALAVVLPHIDVGVLRLAGYDDALGRIEELRARGAFVVPDGERDGRYLCHDLFRDFVRRQIELEGGDAMRLSKARAGEALERSANITEALSLYAQAEDRESVLRLLDRYGIALYEDGHADAIAGALEALDAAGRSHGIPLALRAQMDAGAGRYDRAIAQLRRAAGEVRSAEMRGKIVLWAARAAINSWAQSPEELLLSVEADEQISAETRGEAAAMLAVVYARAGNTNASEAACDRAIGGSDYADSPDVHARVLQRTGLAATICMRYDIALGRLQRCADLCERFSLTALATRTYACLYNVSAACGDPIEQLQSYAQHQMVSAERSGETLDLQGAIENALDVEIRRGDAERVVELEKRHAAIRTTDSSHSMFAASARAWVQAWRGRFEDAYRLAAPTWTHFKVPVARAQAGAVCAVYAAAAGRADESAAIASQVSALLERPVGAPDWGDTAVQVPQLFLALAHGLAGRRTIAQRLSRRANIDREMHPLRQAVLEGVRALAERANDGTGLADAIARLRVAGYGGFARLVGAVIDAALERDRSSRAGVLTPSETAVLRRLAQGRSPKEIAEETGRSVYTVQAHVQNAIERLGCHGRHEAIALARRLGLLDS